MDIKMIHCMLEKIVACAKCELEEKGIEKIDTKELGEVADIIKDLSESLYYRTITVAMDEAEYGEDYDEHGQIHKRYYRGQPRDSMGRYMRRRGYEEPPYYHMTPDMYKEHEPEYWRDMDRHEGKMYYTETVKMHDTEMMRDHREGRAGMARRGYMETKETHPGMTPEDKQTKARELEKYMNELSSDVTEMIAGASNEEKTMLKAKMQALLAKI